MVVTETDAVSSAVDVIVDVKVSVLVPLVEPLSKILEETEDDALLLKVSDTVPDTDGMLDSVIEVE